MHGKPAGQGRARVVHLLPGLWAGSGEGIGVPPAVQRLGRWLGRAREVAKTAEGAGRGWEAALAERLGYRQPGSGPRSWLAQPVSLTAGMTDLVAHPVSGIGMDEREALWAAAQPDLEAAGARLGLSAHGLWLLELDGADAWDGLPPSVGCGAPMTARPLAGDVARRLQVLANALQMAWFQHPVNRQREQAGQAPVQGLWFWSPGRPQERPAVGRVCGGGPVARWLAEEAGVAWSPDPADAARAAGVDGDTAVVMEALAAPPTPERRVELLESLAEEVLAPQLRALWRGRLGALEFVDPQTAGEGVPGPLRLRRGDLLALWRRPRRP